MITATVASHTTVFKSIVRTSRKLSMRQKMTMKLNKYVVQISNFKYSLIFSTDHKRLSRCRNQKKTQDIEAASFQTSRTNSKTHT